MRPGGGATINPQKVHAERQKVEFRGNENNFPQKLEWSNNKQDGEGIRSETRGNFEEKREVRIVILKGITRKD